MQPAKNCVSKLKLQHNFFVIIVYLLVGIGQGSAIEELIEKNLESEDAKKSNIEKNRL